MSAHWPRFHLEQFHRGPAESQGAAGSGIYSHLLPGLTGHYRAPCETLYLQGVYLCRAARVCFYFQGRG